MNKQKEEWALVIYIYSTLGVVLETVRGFSSLKLCRNAQSKVLGMTNCNIKTECVQLSEGEESDGA